MKVEFKVNLLLWTDDEQDIWLEDLIKMDEIIEVDYVEFFMSHQDGNIGIGGENYSFNLEGIFEEDGYPNISEQELWSIIK